MLGPRLLPLLQLIAAYPTPPTGITRRVSLPTPPLLHRLRAARAAHPSQTRATPVFIFVPAVASSSRLRAHLLQNGVPSAVRARRPSAEALAQTALPPDAARVRAAPSFVAAAAELSAPPSSATATASVIAIPTAAASAADARIGAADNGIFSVPVQGTASTTVAAGMLTALDPIPVAVPANTPILVLELFQARARKARNSPEELRLPPGGRAGQHARIGGGISIGDAGKGSGSRAAERAEAIVAGSALGAGLKAVAAVTALAATAVIAVVVVLHRRRGAKRAEAWACRRRCYRPRPGAGNRRVPGGTSPCRRLHGAAGALGATKGAGVGQRPWWRCGALPATGGGGDGKGGRGGRLHAAIG